MASVIVEAGSFGGIIGVLVVDKVANLLIFLFLVFGFVFVIDDGFNIEKGISSVSATLSAVTLRDLD